MFGNTLGLILVLAAFAILLKNTVSHKRGNLQHIRSRHALLINFGACDALQQELLNAGFKVTKFEQRKSDVTCDSAILQ